MRVSLNWVKRLLGIADLGVPVSDLLELLTVRSTEIEPEVERTGPSLDGVVVGRVLTCAQHPNADRLRVTTVDIGAAQPVPIVCGAPNVAAGQLVAVATVGTTLTVTGKDGAPASLTIKPAKLRGEPSQGMICAEDELGLGASHDGIMVLTGDHRPGTPLAQVVGGGDVVLVIDNHGISHRPDLWGHWGWAREIAAILGLPPPAPPDSSWTADEGAWKARIEDAGCVAYAGAVVSGLTDGESPRWMRDLLQAVGIRPLGLLVDVTNFVMAEIGEPMHAFDRRDIDGTTMIARAATAGETMRTLDGREHALQPGDIVIADARRPLALAGIMGGEGSMVRPDTGTVVLEAALFRPDRVRRTRIRLGLSTESATRFEKGLYPEMPGAALNRAIALLRASCPEARVEARFAAGALSGDARRIAFPAGAVERLVGVAPSRDEQLALLARLGFGISADAVEVPWWRRKDIHATVDIVEEVARLHGLHHVTPEVPRLPTAAPPRNRLREAEHRVRRLLSGLGWDEVATYGFTSQAWAGRIGADPAQVIGLRNPLSAEWTVLRPSLVPTLAEAVARNRRHLAEVRLYEVGKRYGAGVGHGDTPDEELVLAGMCAAPGDAAPSLAARDAALAVLRGLGHAPEAVPTDADGAEQQRGRTLALRVGAASIGVVSELPGELRDAAGCPERVGWFRIDLERLVRELGEPRPAAYRAPSRFPQVDREFTWVCPEDLPYGRLETLTRGAAGALCADVELITIYRGDPIPAGHKAVSVRVLLQAEDRTLEERELQQLQSRIVKAVEAQTTARIRG